MTPRVSAVAYVHDYARWVGEVIEDGHHIVLIDFVGTVKSGTLAAADDADEVRWVDLSAAGDYPLTPTMYELVEELTR